MYYGCTCTDRMGSEREGRVSQRKQTTKNKDNKRNEKETGLKKLR